MRMMMIVLLLIITGCSAVQAREKVEKLLSFSVKGKQVMVQVMSNGCTQPTDFTLSWKQSNNTAELLLKRHKADRCRKMPAPITVTLELPEPVQNSGLVTVMNPFKVSR